jgi:hypothetical protein
MSAPLGSLFDMLELNARHFLEVVSLIQHTKTSLENDGELKNPVNNSTLQKMMIERCADLEKSLIVLNASITQMAVEELKEQLSSPYLTFEHIHTGFDDITKTLKRELSTAVVLALDNQERALFKPLFPLFGEDFALRFQNQGLFELSEAAKCLALDRPTAAVFHLMRIMEIGIRAIADCLGIPDPIKPAERNWGKILEKIKGQIDLKWPNTADKMSGDGAIFESLYATLDAAKNPWRNGTMHVESKYTDSEAENMFSVVKAFMMKLSSRLDDEGMPKA